MSRFFGNTSDIQGEEILLAGWFLQKNRTAKEPNRLNLFL